MAREGLAYGEGASPSSLTNTNSLYTYPVGKMANNEWNIDFVYEFNKYYR